MHRITLLFALHIIIVMMAVSVSVVHANAHLRVSSFLASASASASSTIKASSAVMAFLPTPTKRFRLSSSRQTTTSLDTSSRSSSLHCRHRHRFFSTTSSTHHPILSTRTRIPKICHTYFVGGGGISDGAMRWYHSSMPILAQSKSKSTYLKMSSSSESDERILNGEDAASASAPASVIEQLKSNILKKKSSLSLPSTSTEEEKYSYSIYDILEESIRILKEQNAPEPTSSACHLLSFALQSEFTWKDNGFAKLLWLLDDKDNNNNHKLLGCKPMPMHEIENFCHMLERRIANEPLQYIIGQWDFHNVVLKIRPPCLCPRPETEELVEYAARDIQERIDFLTMQMQMQMQHQKKKGKKKISNGERQRQQIIRVLDVGCGTGAIGIALSHMLTPNDDVKVEIVAIDVVQTAVDLSNENAQFFFGEQTLKQKQYKSILCSAEDYTNKNMDDEDEDEDKGPGRRQTSKDQSTSSIYDFQFDVVVSNPPYIPSKDMDTLTSDVIDFEDYGALCGGGDGLDVIRDILRRLPEWTSRQNSNSCDDGDDDDDDNDDDPPLLRLNPVCWMEVDTSHPHLIERLVNDNKAEFDQINFIEGIKDFGGLDRFVKLEIKK